MIRAIPLRGTKLPTNTLVYSRFITTCRPNLQPRQYNAPSPITIQAQTQSLSSAPPLSTPLRNWRNQPSFPRIRYAGPIAYGFAFSASAFITSAIIFDRNQQTLWDRLRLHSRQWSFFGSTEESMLAELWREKRDLLIEKRHHLLENLARRLDAIHLPQDIKRAIWMLGEKFATLSEAEKTLTGLIAINTVVFACWQIPRLAPFMSKWFLHLPGSRQNVTLLTSCFSHQEFFHFALNMVGLWSFGRVVHDALGREQFVAMYLSAGIGANVVSHVCSLALRNARPLLPSLGASGAIYGLLASTAAMYPNSSISLIFLPMIPIKLG
jgi:membrane associated rhomboid family serine protease